MLKTPFNIENILVSATKTEGATPTFVTSAEAKAFMRVDYTTDDTIIDLLIQAAYDAFEAYTNRSLRTYDVVAVWEQYGASVDLPYAPVTSVTTVEYRFEDGTNNDVTSIWEQVGDQIRVLKPEEVAYGNRLVVTYSTGYASIPNKLKLGLLKWIATNYEDRQNTAEMSISEVPGSSKELWADYRILTL